MWFDEFSLFSLIPQDQHTNSNSSHDGQKHKIVEVFGDRIEGLVRCDPNQEDVRSVTHNEDCWLHITWAELNPFEVVQIQIVRKELRWVEWQQILIWWIGLIRKQRCFFGSSCANQFPANHVQLIISRDNKQVPPDQWLLTFTDKQFLDGHWRPIDLTQEDDILSISRRLIIHSF